MVAEGVDAVGIVTTAVLFDTWVLGTAPAFEEMSNEMDAPETNLWYKMGVEVTNVAGNDKDYASK